MKTEVMLYHVCIRTKNIELSEHLVFEEVAFMFVRGNTDTKTLMR